MSNSSSFAASMIRVAALRLVPGWQRGRSEHTPASPGSPADLPRRSPRPEKGATSPRARAIAPPDHGRLAERVARIIGGRPGPGIDRSDLGDEHLEAWQGRRGLQRQTRRPGCCPRQPAGRDPRWRHRSGSSRHCGCPRAGRAGSTIVRISCTRATYSPCRPWGLAPVRTSLPSLSPQPR